MEFQVRLGNKKESNKTQLHSNAQLTVGRDRKYKNTLQTEDLQSFRKMSDKYTVLLGFYIWYIQKFILDRERIKDIEILIICNKEFYRQYEIYSTISQICGRRQYNPHQHIFTSLAILTIISHSSVQNLQQQQYRHSISLPHALGTSNCCVILWHINIVSNIYKVVDMLFAPSFTNIYYEKNTSNKFQDFNLFLFSLKYRKLT